MKVVGVDGCRGGWIAVEWNPGADSWVPRCYPSFSDLLRECADADAIGVDIPIGLRDDVHPRHCDIEARMFLGWPRSSSVFPAPQRSLLECANFAEASARSRSRFGKGISRQAFNIYDKVREVDALMTPNLQKQIVEVHPEVTFKEMNSGQQLADSKKTSAGFDARRTLLAGTVTRDTPTSRVDARRLVPNVGADDLLDAFAAAWTAHRVATGDALRFPDVIEIDERGLRMEIVR